MQTFDGWHTEELHTAMVTVHRGGQVAAIRESFRQEPEDVSLETPHLGLKETVA